ncbi:hypothetical protein C8R46DRAFT_1228322 [Mycena filopes]|nr:hypothetical protein C8R46DRAFT_1228322 [Mycena filopes]
MCGRIVLALPLVCLNFSPLFDAILGPYILWALYHAGSDPLLSYAIWLGDSESPTRRAQYNPPRILTEPRHQFIFTSYRSSDTPEGPDLLRPNLRKYYATVGKGLESYSFATVAVAFNALPASPLSSSHLAVLFYGMCVKRKSGGGIFLVSIYGV